MDDHMNLLLEIGKLLDSKLQAQFQPIKEDIAELKHGQVRLEGRMTGMEDRQTTLTTEVSGLKTGLAGLESEVSGLKTEMHERFDKLESITEYSLRHLDELEQAYRSM